MGKNKIGMMLIIVLLIVLLILFGVGFTLLYKAMNNANSDSVEPVVIVKEEVSIENITNFPISDTILTNLLEGPDQKRHVIKLSLSLGINNSKDVSKDATTLLTLLEAQTPIIKDLVIGVCRNKTFEELNKSDAKAILKEEILAKLQDTFKTDLIIDVYIDEIFID